MPLDTRIAGPIRFGAGLGLAGEFVAPHPTKYLRTSNLGFLLQPRRGFLRVARPFKAGSKYRETSSLLLSRSPSRRPCLEVSARKGALRNLRHRAGFPGCALHIQAARRVVRDPIGGDVGSWDIGPQCVKLEFEESRCRNSWGKITFSAGACAFSRRLCSSFQAVWHIFWIGIEIVQRHTTRGTSGILPAISSLTLRVWKSMDCQISTCRFTSQ